MNTESIFQYLLHDLQNMENIAAILPTNEEVKRTSLVFESADAVLKDFTSVVQCVEAGEVLPDVQILRLITNLNVEATQDTQMLGASLDHVYPMLRFIASDGSIFVRLDVPMSVNAIWESSYMTKLIGFYQAVIAYNAPIFQALVVGKMSLQEAFNKTRKQ